VDGSAVVDVPVETGGAVTTVVVSSVDGVVWAGAVTSTVRLLLAVMASMTKAPPPSAISRPSTTASVRTRRVTALTLGERRPMTEPCPYAERSWHQSSTEPNRATPVVAATPSPSKDEQEQPAGDAVLDAGRTLRGTSHASCTVSCRTWLILRAPQATPRTTTIKAGGLPRNRGPMSLLEPIDLPQQPLHPAPSFTLTFLTLS
jgi:hypothetical protein